MRAVVTVGIVLIVLGILALAWQGISFVTHKKVADLGPVEVKTSQRKTVPIPPIAGAAAVVAGIVLVVAGGRRDRA